MEVLREYQNSHHYMTSCTKTDYYCPCCGLKSLWVDEGSGDYYQGSEYLCVSCGASHRLDLTRMTVEKDQTKLAILEQLRSGKTFVPTTKRGL